MSTTKKIRESEDKIRICKYPIEGESIWPYLGFVIYLDITNNMELANQNPNLGDCSSLNF